MKELYLNAEMNVVEFAANDVITTSAAEPVVTTTEWKPTGNEGMPDYSAWD